MFFSSCFFNKRRDCRWLRFVGLSLLSSIICWLPIAHLSIPTAQPLQAFALEAQAQVEAGVALYEESDFFGAIKQWKRALKAPGEPLSKTDRSTVLENLARAYQRMGHTTEALDHWEQAILETMAVGDLQQLGRLKTEQAQLYSRTGQQRRAIALLCGGINIEVCTENSAIALANATEDRTGRIAAIGSLGEVLRRQRDYRQAQTVIESSLAESQALGNSSYQILALSSLGALHSNQALSKRRRAASLGELGDGPLTADLNVQADRHAADARRYFEQSLALAEQKADGFATLRSQLSLAALYRQTGDILQLQAAQENLLAQLQQMPADINKVEATIALADLIQFETAPGELGASQSVSTQCFEGTAKEQTQVLLASAAEQAQALANERAASFAIGSLGHWYECQGAYTEAMQLTQQAQWLANQQRQAPDSLYLWHWQMGRLYLAQGKVDEALSSYQQAVAVLDSIRNDLLASHQDLQFDFRETVEPVYRQLVALRLETPVIEQAVAREVGGNQLWQAIATMDSLKLAELQNYFGGDCEILPFAEAQTGLTGAASTTAIVTSIVLDQQTAVIASLPNGQRWISWIPATSATLRDTVNEFRQGLERFYDLSFDTALAQQLYNWMIRPFAEQLANNNIETLVFVNDGILRSIPMAALHDGEKFLAQTFATATVPALSLTAPSNLTPKNAKALVLGLTQSATVDGQAFEALPFVDQEAIAIQSEVPDSEVLLNDAFTSQRLSEELSEHTYSVLHIATHARFGANPEDAFLITGQGEKLTFGEMDRLIRSSTGIENKPIELLALTACETAIGDDRAALGVGGVAVRAGAKSAIASLWSIGDESTAKLSTAFYQGLVDENLSKAKALQQAQITLIEDHQHPAVWSPLIVVGNWR